MPRRFEQRFSINKETENENYKMVYVGIYSVVPEHNIDRLIGNEELAGVIYKDAPGIYRVKVRLIIESDQRIFGSIIPEMILKPIGKCFMCEQDAFNAIKQKFLEGKQQL